MDSLYYTPVICEENSTKCVLTFNIVMLNIENEIFTFIMFQI